MRLGGEPTGGWMDGSPRVMACGARGLDGRRRNAGAAGDATRCSAVRVDGCLRLLRHGDLDRVGAVRLLAS